VSVAKLAGESGINANRQRAGRGTLVVGVARHASLQTTTMYVQAEKQRMVEEVARYYADLAARKTGT
jgi:hypothetical protein